MNKVDIDQQLGSKRVCVSDEFLVEFKALFLSVFKGGFLGSKTRLFQYKIAKKLNRFFPLISLAFLRFQLEIQIGVGIFVRPIWF